MGRKGLELVDWGLVAEGVVAINHTAIPNLGSPPPSPIIRGSQEVSKLGFKCIEAEMYLVNVLNAMTLLE